MGVGSSSPSRADGPQPVGPQPTQSYAQYPGYGAAGQQAQYYTPYPQPQMYASYPGQPPYYGAYPGGAPQGAQPPAQAQQGPAPGTYGQPRPVQTQQYQRTATIRNQVNLKKASLRLQSVNGSSAEFAISFTFDASAACRVLTFVNATEDVKRNCRVTSTESIPQPSSFERGYEHKFPPDEATARAHFVDTTKVQDANSSRPGYYPIIIRLEALTDEGRADGRSLDGLAPGCELPHWVQSQTTYAKLVKEDDGSWGIRVLKQKIWVKGEAYELQEIYGMEQNKSSGTALGTALEDVEGNECVICMSAARDTAALPCRHMCMCHGCATALKTQTNKCPICRNEIESLLHIKINKGGRATGQPANGAAATPSS